MSDTGLVVFRGDSGKAYPFHACSMDTSLKNVGAVYALTKRRKGDGGKDFHSIFYIGQTASLGETVSRHRKDPWLEQFHGNCVCIHLEKDEGQRKKKIVDLSRRYHPKMKINGTEPEQSED